MRAPPYSVLQPARWCVQPARGYAGASPLLLGLEALLLAGRVAWCAGLLNRLSVCGAVQREVDRRVGLVCSEALRRA